jgi:hypothetical protein
VRNLVASMIWPGTPRACSDLRRSKASSSLFRVGRSRLNTSESLHETS